MKVPSKVVKSWRISIKRWSSVQRTALSLRFAPPHIKASYGRLPGMNRASCGLKGPHAHTQAETFILFSQDIPSQSLGFVDSQASTLEITVAGHDLIIQQSPGLLTSNRKEGTTGAGRCGFFPSSLVLRVHDFRPCLTSTSLGLAGDCDSSRY